jgi:hypothetical protein
MIKGSDKTADVRVLLTVIGCQGFGVHSLRSLSALEETQNGEDEQEQDDPGQ